MIHNNPYGYRRPLCVLRLLWKHVNVSILCLTAVTVISVLMICGTTRARNRRGWNYPMFRDPLLPKVGIKRILATPADINLWQQMLSMPDPVVDTQLCAVINRQQQAGLHLPPPLLQELTNLALGQRKTRGALSASQIASWRTAQIAALQVVGRSMATRDLPALIQLDHNGSPSLVMAVDPLLYGLHNGQMLKIWRERAADNQLLESLRQSAVMGLQKDLDVIAQPTLLKICFAPQTQVRLRLAAARALAAMHFHGSLPPFNLVEGGHENMMVHQVIDAILILGENIPSQIIGLCRNENPTIRLMGLRRIEKQNALSREFIEADGGQLADGLVHSPLASICHAITRIAHCAAIPASIPLLMSQLGDRRRYIRDDARIALTQLAGTEPLHQQIITDALNVLKRPTTKMNAQVQEQSLLLLGRLHVSSAIGPAARLLRSRSNRVVLASVIALRRLKAAHQVAAVYQLAVKILNREILLKRQTMQRLAKQHIPGGGISSQQYTIHLVGSVLVQSQTMSQAFCMLGKMKYRKSIPILVRLIPQFGPFATRSREAAIWALGKIYDGHADPRIARQLLSRLNDAYRLPPEEDGVRAMAAIALARMGYKPALSSIRAFAEAPGTTPSRLACNWAVRKLSGKVYPVPVKDKKIARGFIQPYAR
ncbi:MAG: HEAT repeat domain-containing protein [Phycisphaerae bacterium]